MNQGSPRIRHADILLRCAVRKCTGARAVLIARATADRVTRSNANGASTILRQSSRIRIRPASALMQRLIAALDRSTRYAACQPRPQQQFPTYETMQAFAT
jgi:hypothetical protein